MSEQSDRNFQMSTGNYGTERIAIRVVMNDNNPLEMKWECYVCGLVNEWDVKICDRCYFNSFPNGGITSANVIAARKARGRFALSPDSPINVPIVDTKLKDDPMFKFEVRCIAFAATLKAYRDVEDALEDILVAVVAAEAERDTLETKAALEGIVAAVVAAEVIAVSVVAVDVENGWVDVDTGARLRAIPDAEYARYKAQVAREERDFEEYCKMHCNERDAESEKRRKKIRLAYCAANAAAAAKAAAAKDAAAKAAAEAKDAAAKDAAAKAAAAKDAAAKAAAEAKDAAAKAAAEAKDAAAKAAAEAVMPIWVCVCSCENLGVSDECIHCDAPRTAVPLVAEPEVPVFASVAPCDKASRAKKLVKKLKRRLDKSIAKRKATEIALIRAAVASRILATDEELIVDCETVQDEELIVDCETI